MRARRARSAARSSVAAGNARVGRSARRATTFARAISNAAAVFAVRRKARPSAFANNRIRPAAPAVPWPVKRAARRRPTTAGVVPSATAASPRAEAIVVVARARLIERASSFASRRAAVAPPVKFVAPIPTAAASAAIRVRPVRVVAAKPTPPTPSAAVTTATRAGPRAPSASWRRRRATRRTIAARATSIKTRSFASRTFSAFRAAP